MAPVRHGTIFRSYPADMDPFEPDYDAVGDYHDEEIVIPLDRPHPAPDAAADPETAQFIRDLEYATRPGPGDTTPTLDWRNRDDDYPDDYDEE